MLTGQQCFALYLYCDEKVPEGKGTPGSGGDPASNRGVSECRDDPLAEHRDRSTNDWQPFHILCKNICQDFGRTTNRLELQHSHSAALHEAPERKLGVTVIVVRLFMKPIVKWHIHD